MLQDVLLLWQGTEWQQQKLAVYETVKAQAAPERERDWCTCISSLSCVAAAHSFAGRVPATAQKNIDTATAYQSKCT